LPDCNTPLQQEGADLIDDAGPLTDQAVADAVQGLQVLVATYLMVGRCTASAIASASRKSLGDIGMSSKVRLEAPVLHLPYRARSGRCGERCRF